MCLDVFKKDGIIMLGCGSVGFTLAILKCSCSELIESSTPSEIPTEYINIPSKGINSVSFRADGRLIVTGGWDGSIRLFRLKTLTPLAVLNTPHTEGIQSIAFTMVENGFHYFAAGSKDSRISIWNMYNK